MHNPHARLDSLFVIRKLDTAGYRVTPQIPPSVPSSDCFLYLESGELLVDIEEESYLIKGGQFFFIPHGKGFSIRYYDNTSGYMGAFSLSVLKNSHYSFLHVYSPVLLDIPEIDVPFVSGLAGKLFREFFSGTAVHDPMIVDVLDLFLEQMDIFYARNHSVIRSRICSRFLDMVFDRESALLSVSEYAGVIGVSPNHLNRVVKKETGKNAGEWIDISRVTLAKLLLRQSELPVLDIALKVGFDDQSYFSRFFKKHTGLTPSEFRNV